MTGLTSKHYFSISSYFLGNSFGLNPKGGSLFQDYQEPTCEDYLQANGKPPNLRPPVVALLAPAQEATVPSGPLVEEEQGALFLTYRQARDAGGLAGRVEWPDDLSVWEASGIAEVVIRDMPGETYVVVAAVIPAGGTGTRFARLKVKR